jgi:rhodanese-related sulfurtransferase
MFKIKKFPVVLLLFLSAFLCATNAVSEGGKQGLKVRLTAAMEEVVIDHQGIPVTVQRIQDTNNRLVDDFTKTSRPCPPFCIHPITAGPGVRTIGELELLEFLQTTVKNEEGVLLDARMPNWYNSETIPGAINVPFIMLTKASEKRDRLLGVFGVKNKKGVKDFSGAIKLTLFCNGPWCDQSPRAIKGLIGAGYPAEKLQYYRGGMQAWKSVGLTTVIPESNTVGE